MFALKEHVTLLPGVGPARAQQLEALGILTIKDLLYYAPFRYETVERAVQIKDLQSDTTVCIRAKVTSKIPIKQNRFRSMLKVSVTDGTGNLSLTWFNNQFILSSLKVGGEYYFTGKVTLYQNKPTLTNPTVDRQTPEFGSLVPIYYESVDINSRYLRKIIRFAFSSVDLNDDSKMMTIYKKHGLIGLREALETLHQIPNSKIQIPIENAKQRLAFDEMFFLIKDVMERKKEHQAAQPTTKLKVTSDQIKLFYTLFPYAPTPSQKEAIGAIARDLNQPHPMERLIQGEVGSGKTTVAAFALWVVAQQHKKAVLVCPTNILATQHLETLKKIIPTIGLFTGSEKSESSDILVATHAIFTKKNFKPAIVIIDEEHRFGVKQREHFFTGKKKPHFISMTATPIPRTVALTALADRDISYILPHKSNSNIKTWVVPTLKRKSAYAWINKTLKESGEQGIIVCPFIEESYVETLTAVKSAKKEFLSLKKVFTGFKLELLHGSLKNGEKDRVFADVMAGKTDILVTTPVVEVGVDIPKASIVVIEGAERYGLAGLHQLRGRVGRRGQDAYCLLFTTDGIQSSGRLSFFSKTYDGNALAEYDLKHRGSGELLGIRQHGFDSLKFASWSDLKLIETCKHELSLEG